MALNSSLQKAAEFLGEAEEFRCLQFGHFQRRITAYIFQAAAV
jgi:hypothetical protein